MKIILQDLKTGRIHVTEVPSPKPAKGYLLIRSTESLISSGTERMLLDFGKANLLNKARQQPDKVRQVIDKINTDGLLPTFDAVRAKMDRPLTMGYSNVGQIVEVGVDVKGFSIGDRVVSNGPHAEIVRVPVNLCARIPDKVTDESASFTVLGAIALQGIRLAQPTLGECFVVTGLGVIGLLTVQILRAHGCRVLGIDYDEEKLRLAEEFGAQTVNASKINDPLVSAKSFSKERGVDGVLITASTKSSEPVHQAAQMCRKRGRIVLVGVTGLELSRADFFEKELTFQVSCSYGPGRYDPNYEEKGHDYPVGFVRWTEQRNFEAVLNLMAEGQLDVNPFITHRFGFENAKDAYKKLIEDRSALGILLEYTYGEDPDFKSKTVHLAEQARSLLADDIVAGFIGSGNYAIRELIPAFKAAGAVLKTVASIGGVSGVIAGRKYGFEETKTDTAAIVKDEVINTIVISTRHDSHARLTIEALQAGKHVFVEKPLALTLDDLEEIENCYLELAKQGSSPLLMVGFNRRFAPQISRIKQLLESVTVPKSFILTVNAGAIPADHWTQDPQIGGGRIIGEACHFIDLLRFLADSNIRKSDIVFMDSGFADTASIQLSFANGSVGSVHYFANGSKSFSKERLEIFTAGRILQLDNFRRLRGYGWPGFKKMNLLKMDKGQRGCASAFVKAVREGKSSPIPFDEIMEVSRVTVQLARKVHR